MSIKNEEGSSRADRASRLKVEKIIICYIRASLVQDELAQAFRENGNDALANEHTTLSQTFEQRALALARLTMEYPVAMLQAGQRRPTILDQEPSMVAGTLRAFNHIVSHFTPPGYTKAMDVK